LQAFDCHYVTVTVGDTGSDASTDGRLETLGYRSLAFGLGGVGLLADFTGWFTFAGAVFGLLGFAFALFCPRGKLRRTVLWLNGATFILGVVILAVLL
jgi:hypothetical protein